jgi:glycine hydroxymethyltransferase
MREAEMHLIGDWIAQVLTAPADENVSASVGAQVRELCESFPLYPQFRREHVGV